MIGRPSEPLDLQHSLRECSWNPFWPRVQGHYRGGTYATSRCGSDAEQLG
jgi:hypothetical protein